MTHQVFKLFILNNDSQVKEIHLYDPQHSNNNKTINPDITTVHDVKLYGDDTIENIKYKLCSVLKDTNINHYSFHYESLETYDAKTLFYTMSKGMDIIMEKDMHIFCVNRNIERTKELESNTYTFEDFLTHTEKYFQDPSNRYVTKSLDFLLPSHKCIMNIQKNEYEYRQLLHKAISLNSHLLFEMGNIKDNALYAVHKDDYKESLQSNYIEPLYFPLKDKPISNLSEKYDTYNQYIEKHHSFSSEFNTKHSNPDAIINHFEFVCRNQGNIVFPLEIFFKKIHSSQEIPLIQYKPSTQNDTIYRLYAPYIDINGKKKPYLPKKTTLTCKFHFTKENSVSLFYYIQYNDLKKINVYFDIDHNGNIYVSVDKINLSKEDLLSFCLSVLNKTIEKIIKTIDPVRIMFKEVPTFENDNIHILDIHYKINLHQYDIKEIKSACNKYFQTIFHVLEYDSHKLDINYKRVSNYNKMNDINATITKLYNKGESIETIFSKVKAFFSDDQEKAIEHINNVISTISMSNQLQESGMKYQKMSVKHNPGFLIQCTNKELIVSNMNHFDYILYFRIFLDNLLYISLHKEKKQTFQTFFNKNTSNAVLVNAPEVAITNYNQENEPNENQWSNNESQWGNNDDPESDSEEETFDNDKTELNKTNSKSTIVASNNPIIESETNTNEIPQNEKEIELEDEPEQSSQVQEDDERSIGTFTDNEKELSQDQEDDERSIGTFTDNEAEQPSQVQKDEDSVASFTSDEEEPQSQPQNEELEAEGDDEPDAEDEESNVEDEESAMSYTDNEAEQSQDEMEEEEEDAESALSYTDNEADPSQDEMEEEDAESAASYTDNEAEEPQDVVEEEQEDADSVMSYTDNEGGEDDESVKSIQMGGKVVSLHPNPFNQKIETKRSEKDSSVFWYDKKQKGVHNQYSRSCPWVEGRVPVLITENEKKEIEEKMPDFFHENSVLQYSTNPLKEKLYYTCPRYWNLRTNLPVNEKDIDPSTIIPENEKSVDLDKKYIIEFKKMSHTNQKNEHYVTKYPGLMVSKNKKGMFMPCCFTKRGNAFKSRIAEAEQQMKEIEEAGLTTEEEIIHFLENRTPNSSKKTSTYEDHIVWKVPLKKDRYGYLPPHLEELLKVSHRNCNTKQGVCLLRKGGEITMYKSFLSSIAILLLKKPSVENMIQKIKEVLTIDNILYFQNATLPSLFYNEEQLSNVNLKKYNQYPLFKRYKKVAKRDKRQLSILINGYENFLKYLEDKTEYVDYHYLWDIVCSGILNEHSENKPLNMIIIKENTKYNTLNLVCPSPGSQYRSFEPKDKTIILYHKDDFFEPIMMRDKSKTNWKKRIKCSSFFEEKDGSFMKHLKEKMEKEILPKCNYHIKDKSRSLDFMELLEKHGSMIQRKYTIENQIIGLDNKVFGIQLKEKETNTYFFIPLKPSALHPEYSYEFYHETIWQDYDNTKKYLTQFYEDTNQELPCNPLYKIISDDIIIGFKTKSNQFVKIRDPLSKTLRTDDLENEEGYDIYAYDDDIYHNGKQRDHDRKITMRNIRLEKQFYNAFLNNVRYQLQKYKNHEIKAKIKEILKNDSQSDFETQQTTLYDLLYHWSKDYFEFTTYSDNVLNELLDDIHICAEDGEPQEYCRTFQNGENQKLMIPQENLYTKEDNELKYISFLVHDLLLNNDIQMKLMTHSPGYFYDDYIYKVKKNEIILLERTLSDYYDSLGKHNRSKYVLHDVYETITPEDITQIMDSPETEVVDEESSDEESSQIDEEEDSYALLQDTENNIEQPQEKVIEENKTFSDNEQDDDDEQDDDVVENMDGEDDDEEDVLIEQIEKRLNNNKGIQEESLPEDEPEQQLSEDEQEEEQQDPEDEQEDEQEQQQDQEDEPEQEDEQENESSEKEEQEAVPQDEPEQQQDPEDEPEQEDEQEPEQEDEQEESPQKSVSNSITDKIPIPSFLNKIFIHKNKELPKPLKRGEESIKIFNKTQDKNLREAHSDCTQSVSLTKKWKNYFPKLTTEFTLINMDNVKCNYLIMTYILKLYQPELYQKITINHLKTLLIEFYKEYTNDTQKKKKIIQKWKKQHKKEQAKLLASNTPIETIIQDSTYPLSEMDICLIMWNMKIPMVLYFAAKKTVKCIRFNTHQEGKKHFFYVRLSTGKKLGGKMNLNKIGRNPLINIYNKEGAEGERLSNRNDFIEKIQSNTLTDFDSYLYS
jgi:hypothetical protein